MVHIKVGLLHLLSAVCLSNVVFAADTSPSCPSSSAPDGRSGGSNYHRVFRWSRYYNVCIDEEGGIALPARQIVPMLPNQALWVEVTTLSASAIEISANGALGATVPGVDDQTTADGKTTALSVPLNTGVARVARASLGPFQPGQVDVLVTRQEAGWTVARDVYDSLVQLRNSVTARVQKEREDWIKVETSVDTFIKGFTFVEKPDKKDADAAIARFLAQVPSLDPPTIDPALFPAHETVSGESSTAMREKLSEVEKQLDALAKAGTTRWTDADKALGEIVSAATVEAGTGPGNADSAVKNLVSAFPTIDDATNPKTLTERVSELDSTLKTLQVEKELAKHTIFVDTTYTGSIRVGIAAVLAGAANASYDVWTPAGAAVSEIKMNDGGLADMEFTVGYTQYLKPQPVSMNSGRVGVLIGVGLMDFEEFKVAPHSLYAGLDLGWRWASVSPSFVLRHVDRLADGVVVGSPAESNEDIPITRKWEPGFALVFHPAPDLFKFRASNNGAVAE